MNHMLYSVKSFHFLTNILINYDHGIIPACIKKIESDLGINDLQLGLLSSSVYAGIIIGSIKGAGFYEKYKTKQILTLCLLFYILSLSLFLLTKNIMLLYFSRFLTGLFQVCFINLIGIFSNLFSCVD
ncbi:unnamed protein product [Paramecium sonneborni]|uniref:Major facilitator superfamily (MFS) profile domain-containing protein n=1 Tax=Paramecium sonneborni TaxID=65129 RepID=A0A8S1KTF3_9CILI|nr:unnamed protein product [Paramecium sonneborni]